MSRRVSTAPGKAFIWLLAVAMAGLMEGMLLQSSSWASASAYRASVATANVESNEAALGQEVGLYRALHTATMVLRFVGNTP